MKLLILFTIIACLHSSANGFGQTVTLSLNNASLEQAFKELKKQTGYSFVYTRDQLKNTLPVKCNIKNAELKEALELCFRNQPLLFVIEDRYVVVQTKNSADQLIFSKLSTLIRGRVIDEDGEPIAGASVIIKGTTIGTSTNAEGAFTLNVPNTDVVLLITSTTTEAIEVSVNGRTDLLDISVSTTVKILNNVMVNKGYYTTSQKLNTGSVSKVTAAEIGMQPVSNPIAALQGRIPGLLITQRNGLPGSNYTIQIRGQNSIQQGNDPLFIVDGVPFASDNLSRVGAGLNVSNPFNTINPADIETIEILKDADATAIYGSRGANGVILITTKKGKPGKITVNGNFYSGWGKVTRTVNYMNTAQYLEMRREAFRNDGVVPTPTNAPDLFLWDTTRNTDWKKMITGGTSKTMDAQIRMTGGNHSINYSVSAGFHQEGSVLPGNFSYRRGSVSLSLSTSSENKKFTSVTSANYITDENALGSQDLTSFINLPPNMYAPYDSFGKLQWSEGGFSYGNLFALLLQEYSAVSDRLIANSSISYKIIKPLTLKANFNYNNVQYYQYSTRPIASQNPAFNPRGSADFNTTSSKIWNIEPQLEYNGLLSKKGVVQAMIGGTLQQKRDNGLYLNGSGYTNDAQIKSIVGAATVTAQNDYALYRYSSAYARLNFNWNEKYLLNVVARRDASSKFGTNKRLANFGAIGVGWIFSNEKFVQNKIHFVSFGKLRTSYGTTGNDRIGDYQYLDTWLNTVNSYQGQTGIRPARLFNPDYGWEEIRKLNIGLDLGLIKDRILITFDWFRHRSTNQLVSYSLPDQTGFASIIRNIPGVIETRGVEFSITTSVIKTKNFNWKSIFNITIQRNKLIEFFNLANTSYATRYVIGKPVNLFIGSTFLGLNSQTGTYEFKDVNNDGNINSVDYSYQGTTDPKYFGGFSNSFQYKGIDFTFLFEFRKQTGRHAVFGYSNFPGSFINQSTMALDRWQKPGDNKTYQKYTQAFGTPVATAASRTQTSSAALTNASFARLRTLSISYNLNKSILKKLSAANCKVYFQGQNLLTITKYVGADPETQNLQALPPLKIFSFGLNVTF